MKPEKFFNLGLQNGDKVSVVLSIPWGFNNKPKTVKLETYFLGYRTLYGSSLALNNSGIVPVFSKPNKRGTCGRAHYQSYPTWFDYIKSVKKIPVQN